MEKNLKLNFYNYRVVVTSAWGEIVERLEKDFSFFVTDKEEVQGDLKIEIIKDESFVRSLKNKKFSYRSKKVHFFTRKKVRYCLYPSGVASCFDFISENGSIYGENLHGVHEVSYLMILSRVGKALDLMGLHRIHGAALVYKERPILLTFSSGVGKSTLLNELLQYPHVQLMSDDSPLVDKRGKLLPFPLRLGFEEELPLNLVNTPSYELDRYRFGKKKLVSLSDVEVEIAKGGQKRPFIFTGERGEVEKISGGAGPSHFKHFIFEGLIGFGLPILFEYFWEPGLRDLLRKLKIVFLRIRGLSKLFIRSKKYRLTIKDYKKPFQADNPNDNSKILIKLFESS